MKVVDPIICMDHAFRERCKESKDVCVAENEGTQPHLSLEVQFMSVADPITSHSATLRMISYMIICCSCFNMRHSKPCRSQAYVEYGRVLLDCMETSF